MGYWLLSHVFHRYVSCVSHLHPWIETHVRTAIRAGAWAISPETSLNMHVVRGLPVEYASFFSTCIREAHLKGIHLLSLDFLAGHSRRITHHPPAQFTSPHSYTTALSSAQSDLTYRAFSSGSFRSASD
jgi:hypothetical protein